MTTPERVICTDVIPAQTNAGVGRLWDIFDDFIQIPRKTGQEQAMIEYARSWAEENRYEYEIDDMGNMLVIIPATQGYETAPGVILQTHSDMVCVGNPDPAVFGVTPILTENDEVLTTINTSAGFDNGIGEAASLALSEDTSIEHGPLALMITVHEEVGLMGALGMDFSTSLDKYQYLLNFDSEDQGEATISCAGGGDTEITLPIKRESFEGTSYALTIEHLLGGHSGADIHKGRINGIKFLTTIIKELTENLDSFRLHSISAGSARNVIPSNVEAFISIKPEDRERAEEIIENVRTVILEGSAIPDEKKARISLQESDSALDALTKDSAKALMDLLDQLPDGVISWSKEIESLVETSNNLAIVSSMDDKIMIETMTRSSVDSDVGKVRQEIREIAQANGASVILSDPYPGWPANPKSEINQIAVEEWQKLTGEELKIIAIHAGLECGVIIGKYPHLQAISIGPSIKGAHTDRERVYIDSVAQFYLFARNIIARLASETFN